MQRLFFALLFLLATVPTANAQEVAAAEPADGSAKQQFDDSIAQWRQQTEQLKELYKQKAESGDPNGVFAQQISAARLASDKLLDSIVTSGVKLYELDPEGYPKATETLVALASFFVTGDANGDGGDQFERALPIAKALLAGGGGEKWEDLWVWGGVSAYCLMELDLAEQYFKEAQERGLLDNLPQQPVREAGMRVKQQAAAWSRDLPRMKLRWDDEQKIRKREAKDDDLPRVRMVTSQGEVVLELFENEAPQSVANFLTLVNQGYYNNVTFHRVLPMFMAQGGDPQGTGSGGPGYTIRDEHTKPDHRKHFRGSLSMAKTGEPDSGGSQFFLCYVPTSYLDGRHTVFGRVIEGMPHAAAIKRRDPSIGYLPTPDRIISAEIIRDRGHGYRYERLMKK